MDVMKIARERREAMTDQIAALKGQIAKIDEFLELAEEIAAGKTVAEAPAAASEAPVKEAKVAELNANIFSAPAEDAKAS